MHRTLFHDDSRHRRIDNRHPRCQVVRNVDHVTDRADLMTLRQPVADFVSVSYLYRPPVANRAGQREIEVTPIRHF